MTEETTETTQAAPVESAAPAAESKPKRTPRPKADKPAKKAAPKKADKPAKKAAPKKADKPAKKAAPKAKATKPAKAKAVKASGETKRGRVSQFAGKKIYKLVPKNPRREGTIGHNSFSLITNGMKYEKYIELGGRSGDLAFDIAHKYVEVRNS